jgi:hypothetical protein
MSVFSNWLDYKMKELLPLIQPHFTNSTTVVNNLMNLTLPKGATIFSADATSMYTYIDTKTGLSTFQSFFQDNSNKISTEFPVDLFLQVLEIVMKNNIFNFANSYGIQLSGMAMGTPAACVYATITFRHYENTVLLPEFKNNLLYFNRYIDDIFGIWLPHANNKLQTWEAAE